MQFVCGMTGRSGVQILPGALLSQAADGLRMFSRSLRVRSKGFHKYNGSAKEICRQIIKDCWNGRYFQTSAGHFSEFWTRDFGFCIDSLLKLGYRKQVLQTLEYALGRFAKAGRITTTISPSGRPFDFPRFSPDSLAFLMRSLNSAKAKNIIKKHKFFLQNQARQYEAKVIDRKSGLVKDRKFSSIKDGIYRHRSAYDAAMAGMLAKELDKAGIKHNIPDMRKALLENYWTGAYFLDDIRAMQYVAGDANVFPFWTGVVQDTQMMKKAFGSVQNAGLDSPFPLKYTSFSMKADVLAQRLFAPNYEGNTIWAHTGLLYIQLLQKIDKSKAKQHIDAYKQLVEEYKTFIEVYEPDGAKPYKSLFYSADEGMLWAVNLLVLL